MQATYHTLSLSLSFLPMHIPMKIARFVPEVIIYLSCIANEESGNCKFALGCML